MPTFLLASSFRWQRQKTVWICVLGIAFLAGLFVFLHLGRWLVREDRLEKATAIAVLSGRIPGRALEAARIYRQGWATRVWLTHSTEPQEALEKLGVRYVGDEEYNKEVMIRLGVPESAIEVLDPPIVNTADEVKTIGEALGNGPGKVILVTSKVHTRRVRALWNRLASQNGRAIVRGDAEDSYDAAHWWRNTTDALDVLREVLGLMNAWAGLPLRPAG